MNKNANAVWQKRIGIDKCEWWLEDAEEEVCCEDSQEGELVQLGQGNRDLLRREKTRLWDEEANSVKKQSCNGTWCWN